MRRKSYRDAVKIAMLPNLSVRDRRPEVMDQPDLDTGLHHQSLRGLVRLNRLSGSSRILWRELRRFAFTETSRPLRLLDVASGAGDVPIRLQQRARRRGVDLHVDGCDVSFVAIEHARRLAQQRRVPVKFFHCDVLSDPLPGGYDVITCSLFFHHLDESQVVQLLTRMSRAAGRLVLVHDLIRSCRGYFLAWSAGRLFSRSQVVHMDGPLSVAAAFTPDELLSLAAQAGLEGATIRRVWPLRSLLSWRKR